MSTLETSFTAYATRLATRSTEELEKLQQQLATLIVTKRAGEKIGNTMEQQLSSSSSSSPSSDDFMVVAGGDAGTPSTPSASMISAAPVPEMSKGRAYIFLMLDGIPMIWDTKHTEALLRVVKRHADINGTINLDPKSMQIFTSLNLSKKKKLVASNAVTMLIENSTTFSAFGEGAAPPDIEDHISKLPRAHIQSHADVVILLHSGIFSKKMLNFIRGHLLGRGMHVKHLYIRDPNDTSPANNAEQSTADLIRSINIQEEIIKEVVDISTAKYEKTLVDSSRQAEERAKSSLHGKLIAKIRETEENEKLDMLRKLELLKRNSDDAVLNSSEEQDKLSHLYKLAAAVREVEEQDKASLQRKLDLINKNCADMIKKTNKTLLTKWSETLLMK
jgi:hypothetical protein